MCRTGPANEVTIFDDAFARSRPAPRRNCWANKLFETSSAYDRNFFTIVRLALRRDISTQSHQPVLDNGRENK